MVRARSRTAARAKTLAGLLPICNSCKRIRDDEGHWQQVETYIPSHTDALFTPCVCPDCEKQFKLETVTET